MKKILSIFILTILIISCHQNKTDKGVYKLAGMDEEMIPIARQSQDESIMPMDKIEKPELINKKIIKDGRLGLRVEKIENAKMRIDTLVKRLRGYYANESFNNTDWESSYNLKVRIPFENFDKFISDIETGYGEVQYKEIGARDVTDQFIDLETRLENKRNYLQKYNDLLKKANSIKDILEIEEKIRGLEEEIESTTGRLKYLSDLVDYSTLDLTISKQKDFKYNPERRDKFFERLKQSLSKGWYGFVDFLLFVIKIWPFWIIVALMVYFWRKFKRTKKKKNT